MWIVCDAGFFNIVCQDGDAEKGLLTVKARRREDLLELNNYLSFNPADIEESDEADYRFRIKTYYPDVANTIRQLVREIDYPKTKPKLMEKNPDRQMIYLNVWSDLYEIQELHESKA